MRRGKWAAHLYESGRALCPLQREGKLIFSTKGPPPLVVCELSPCGMPYGRICAYCEKRARRAE